MLNADCEGVDLRFADALSLFRQLQTGVRESSFRNIVLGRQVKASALCDGAADVNINQTVQRDG